MVGPAKLLCPEWRRLDVDHPARHRGAAVGMRHVEWRVEDRIMTDAVGVHISLVRQVHQIVDDQAVVALERVKGATFANPIGTVIPMKIGDLRRICERGITRPDPH